MGGHSESLNIEFENDFQIPELINLLQNSPGIIVQNNLANAEYPMPLFAHNKDAVFIGRIRRDESQDKTLNCWIVSDNLRKGAATNAVQIAEYLMHHGLLA
jgi:aspartate-semialdehyde dehydrogenase